MRLTRGWEYEICKDSGKSGLHCVAIVHCQTIEDADSLLKERFGKGIENDKAHLDPRFAP